MTVNFERMQEIFLAAVERHRPEEWEAYLGQACGGDTDLRHQVELLLQAHREAGSVPGSTAVENGATQLSAPPETIGTKIGPYKLIEQIGEGGMGTVWLAQQTEPVKRMVAIKLIKPGMDSKQVIARFEAERQALAMMDHPNIAKVLDAGTTTSGRPYFIMDLVKGVPITRYCDEHHLNPRQRLELFLPVCQAVQHAHQKGVIHRDIKPTNVLVAHYDPSAPGVPKVIDFGVAKATGQQLTERTLHTGFGTVVGTVEYMSPEQATLNQLDIDTRSDIYSLGVLLYELLTGSPPFTRKELADAGILEMLRVIREDEPAKPSTKLSTAAGLPTLAAKRGTEPKRLTALVRGELDWIVMKALEKDRSRRYETASGFALDVQRYLADEAVQACPPSTSYRMRKFVRRNKAAVAITGLTLFFLILMGSGIGWIVRDRSAQRTRVQLEAELALEEAMGLEQQHRWPEALAAAKRADVLLHASGNTKLLERVRAINTDLTLRLRLEEIRLEQAEVQDGHFAVAASDPKYEKVFYDHGLDVHALDPAEAAAKFRTRTGYREIAAALDDWARVRRIARPSESDWTRLIATARAIDSDPFSNQIRDAWARRDGEELKKLAAEALTHPCAPATVMLLETALHEHDADQVVIDLLRQAQRRFPDDFWINHRLAQWLAEILSGERPAANAPRTEWNEVIGFYRASVALRPTSPGAHLNLANALRRNGQIDDCLAAYRTALEIKPDYAEGYDGLGVGLSKKGDLDGAIDAYRKAIRLKQELPNAHHNLGLTWYQQGKLDEAVAEFREAIRLKPDYGDAYYNLGLVLSSQRKSAEAVTAYRDAIRVKPDQAEAHVNLASILRNQGNSAEAIVLLERAVALKPALLQAHVQLGLTLADQERWADATAVYREAIRLHPDSYAAHNNLAIALYQLGNLKDAIAAFRVAAQLMPDSYETHTNLGSLLAESGAIDEAVIELRAAVDLKPDSAEAHNNLGSALDKKGDVAGALAEYRKAIALNTDLMDAQFNLGLCLASQGQLDEALQAFHEVVRIKPDWAEGHFQRGLLLKRQARWNEAIAGYEQALRLDPNHAPSLNNLATLLASCPEHKFRDATRAIALASKAVTLAPQTGIYACTLGECQYRVGDWKAAIETLNRSMELRQGGDANEWLVLALAYWRLGDPEQARGWYDKAVAWLEQSKPVDDDLKGLHAEAAELMGRGK